jgi:hypothetical protein
MEGVFIHTVFLKKIAFYAENCVGNKKNVRGVMGMLFLLKKRIENPSLASSFKYPCVKIMFLIQNENRPDTSSGRPLPLRVRPLPSPDFGHLTQVISCHSPASSSQTCDLIA